ncbi:MAG: hypothetical protein R3C99_01605 [Pirellulaceae bacterium]
MGLYLLGMVLGLVLGWLHWSPEYAQHQPPELESLFRRLGTAVFLLVLMVAHWLLWRWKPATGAALRLVRMFLAFLASTNLLYHFTFLFIVLSDLDSLGRDAPEVIDAAAFRGLMSDPAVYTRALHFSFWPRLPWPVRRWRFRCGEPTNRSRRKQGPITRPAIRRANGRRLRQTTAMPCGSRAGRSRRRCYK